MNKTELINAFAKANEISKKQASELLDSFFHLILETVEKHEEIKIIGFGTFKVSKVNAKTVINPQSKKEMEVKEYHRVRFIPGQALKDSANKKKKK